MSKLHAGAWLSLPFRLAVTLVSGALLATTGAGPVAAEGAKAGPPGVVIELPPVIVPPGTGGADASPGSGRQIPSAPGCPANDRKLELIV